MKISISSNTDARHILVERLYTKIIQQHISFDAEEAYQEQEEFCQATLVKHSHCSSFVFIHLWPEEQGVNSAISFWIHNILIVLTKLDKSGQNSFNLSQVSQGHNSSKLPCRSAHITQSHTALYFIVHKQLQTIFQLLLCHHSGFNFNIL